LLVNCARRTIFVADAHRGNGQRFTVRADEKLTAVMELESAVRAFKSIGERKTKREVLRSKQQRG
jgi:hypothetical protein